MAEDPREIAGMVEKSMGAGGVPMEAGEELMIDLPDAIEDQLPAGVELDTGEQMEVMAEISIPWCKWRDSPIIV